MEDLDAWLWLNASGISTVRQQALLGVYGTAEAIFGSTDSEIACIPGFDVRHVEKLRAAERQLDVAAIKEAMLQIGVHAIVWGTPEYPGLLAETDGAPAVLFAQGGLRVDDRQAVGLVGTRKCTPYGRQIARRLGIDLARRGFTIVSGMADGIDGEAHRGALEAGGRTIAVMASGADRTFPASHKGLRAEIANSGAVVTEFPFGTEPLRHNFPQRNRIISGLSLGIAVIEAPTKSGALITARHAGEQGRPVFAVPGNIDNPNSHGCHALIRDGAELVEMAEDIVAGLGIMLDAVPTRTSTSASPDLTADEASVMETLSFEPMYVDDIVRVTGITVAGLNATLMMLEMKGFVRRFPGNAYVKIQ